MTNEELSISDATLDALDAKLASQIGDDIQVIFDHEYLFKQSRAAITTLRAQLADERQVWPEWAIQIKDKLQSYGVDPGDEWNVAEQFEDWIDETVAEANARADRAEQRVATLEHEVRLREAALAALIQVSASQNDKKEG